MLGWKNIPGFSMYLVSKTGRVWSWHSSKDLTPIPVRDGYLTVGLRKDGKTHKKYVHVLVCEAFHGPRPGPYPQWHACHKDGNHLNNHYANIRWSTVKGNMADQYTHGTRVMGIRHPQAKLTNADVKKIRRSGDKGHELSKRFHVSQSIISEVRTGKIWGHVT